MRSILPCSLVLLFLSQTVWAQGGDDVDLGLLRRRVSNLRYAQLSDQLGQLKGGSPAVAWNPLLIASETNIGRESSDWVGPLARQLSAVGFPDLSQRVERLAQRFPHPSGVPSVVEIAAFDRDEVKKPVVSSSLGSSVVAPSDQGGVEFIPARSSTGVYNYFDPSRTVLYGLRTVVVSKEGIDEDAIGWSQAFDEEYGSVMFYHAGGSQRPPIPVLSNAAINNFRINGAPQSHEASVIYGKLMEGWTVGFEQSDLREDGRVLFFDEVGHAVEATDHVSARFFVALNVKPGYRFVHVQSLRGEGQGSLATPAFASSRTYVDLSEISANTTVSGTLYDEEADENGSVWPLAGSAVQVEGQPGAVISTDDRGKFRFYKNVITVGNYPLFLRSAKQVMEGETLTTMGLIHRYEIVPHPSKSLESINLFRIAEDKVKTEWLNQLEGLSNKTGFVIAVASRTVEQYSDLALFPNVQSWVPVSGMSPREYTLSLEDQLLPRGQLTPGQDRFIGVQIPEGPTTVGVFNSRQDFLWSRLTYVSPRVVTVVGPF